jgi:cell division transport system permease protein
MLRTARLEYAVSETLTNVRRNPFISVAAVLVMTISLFMFGSVFLLRAAIQRSVDLFTGSVEVAVFLDDDVSGDEQDQLRSELEALPEVASVEYESKEQAYQRFLELFRSSPGFTQNVDPTALPASFRVKLKDPSKYAAVNERFATRPGVVQVRDERQTVDQLFASTRRLRQAGLYMAIVVAFAAAVLIATTIRMGIFTRRREIGIMKLVGATNWFVRGPFMVEGLLQGIVGAILAVLLLIPARGPLGSFGPGGLLQTIEFSISMRDVLIHGLLLLAVGALIGVVGSLVGLRRFLDV